MSCDSSTFSCESVECQWSKLMWKPRRCFRPGSGHARHQLLRRDPLGLDPRHDRRAVRVVGADEVHFVPLHPLETRQMSAWMYSMMWPMWNSGPFAYGSAVVTNSFRRDERMSREDEGR